MNVNHAKAQGPGRPKDLEKRAAILTAAQQLFTHQGFEGTSMDAIATAAGVSKLTVYSHFGAKDKLFRDVVRCWMDKYLPEDTYRLDPALDIRGNLLRVARIHARLDCSREAAGSFRAIMGDCQQGKPRYGALIWEESVLRTRAMIQGLLERAVAAGQLNIADMSRATVHFITLIKGDLLLRRLFGCVASDASYEAEINANAEAGVDVFLRAYRSPTDRNLRG